MAASLKRAGLALAAVAGIGLTGCGTAMAAVRPPAAHTAQTSWVVHHTNLAFVTASGTSRPYPTAPLSPGDRVLGRDDISRHGSTVGSGFEACTVGFGLNVLCDYMADVTGVGELQVTWRFQWPSSGTTGPSAWDGVVDGGTGGYANAIGDFHAQALPSGDDDITLRIVQSS